MNTEFDDLEHRLNRLRPARLPAQARRHMLHQIQRPGANEGWKLWLWAHRTGFQVALAGALSLVAVAGLHWLPASRQPASHLDQPALASSNALSPSLGFLEAKLGTFPLMGENTVAALCSPSILTNFQNGR